MTTPWAAPVAARPVRASVELPGSKSATARALVIAALADAPTTLHGALASRDTDLMATALHSLGAGVTRAGGTWTVTPADPMSPASIDCGLAGTVMRFLPPVAALVDGDVRFDGDAEARTRPLAPLLATLRAAGVAITAPVSGTLPLTVHGRGRVTGGSLTVDAAASSQFVSALLLSGCRFDEGLDLRAAGPVPSLPHIAMTVDMLAARGVAVDDREPGRWRIAPGRPTGGTVRIEPDLSNAAPFLAAAVLTGGSVTVPGWPEASQQPGDDLRRILGLFGADVHRSADGLTVSGTGRVHAVDLDLAHAGELTPVLAALAVLADGTSTLRGIGHLRGHETDRLTALATEIDRLGGHAEVLADGLAITPAPLTGTALRAYADHRMAQFGAVVGLVVPGVTVDDIATTAKTLPDFPRMWAEMLRG